eukprot:scaffold100247_cov18-Tisochrysis_lutea.AAC.2
MPVDADQCWPVRTRCALWAGDLKRRLHAARVMSWWCECAAHAKRRGTVRANRWNKLRCT